MVEARVHLVENHSNEIMALIPQQPQRQDPLLNQLSDLHIAAARLGMYDAADWIWKTLGGKE